MNLTPTWKCKDATKPSGQFKQLQLTPATRDNTATVLSAVSTNNMQAEEKQLA